jgi:hypothetical protein
MPPQVSAQDRAVVLQQIYNMAVGNPATEISQKKLGQELANIPSETIKGCLIFFKDLKFIEFTTGDQFRLTGQGILEYENSFKKPR